MQLKDNKLKLENEFGSISRMNSGEPWNKFLLIPDLKITPQKHHFENIYGALAKIETNLFIVLFYCCELLGRTQCEEVTSGAGAIERQLHALLYHAEDSKSTI